MIGGFELEYQKSDAFQGPKGEGLAVALHPPQSKPLTPSATRLLADASRLTFGEDFPFPLGQITRPTVNKPVTLD